MNLMVKGGNVKEFEFGGTSPSVPGRSVGMTRTIHVYLLFYIYLQMACHLWPPTFI